MHNQTSAAIIDTLACWPGVTIHDEDPGIVEFHLGYRELGHLHGNTVLHIPLTPPLRNQLVASGEAKPHPMFPGSNWVEVSLTSDEDADEMIRLLRLNYDRFEQRMTA